MMNIHDKKALYNANSMMREIKRKIYALCIKKDKTENDKKEYRMLLDSERELSDTIKQIDN